MTTAVTDDGSEDSTRVSPRAVSQLMSADKLGSWYRDGACQLSVDAKFGCETAWKVQYAVWL